MIQLRRHKEVQIAVIVILNVGLLLILLAANLNVRATG